MLYYPILCFYTVVDCFSCEQSHVCRTLNAFQKRACSLFTVRPIALEVSHLSKFYLEERTLLLQKKVVRIIAETHYLAHTASLFKDYSLLTITDLYKLQLAIFMYRYHKGTLPKIFDHYFSLNLECY